MPLIEDAAKTLKAAAVAVKTAKAAIRQQEITNKTALDALHADLKVKQDALKSARAAFEALVPNVEA